MKINNTPPRVFRLPIISKETVISTTATGILSLFTTVEDLMFNFIKYIVLFSLLPLCASCGTSPSKELIAKSTMKLDGSNTNIRDLIEIDGYYVEGGLGAEIIADNDRLMFFEDGTYASNFSFKRGLKIENVVENMSESLSGANHGPKRDQWGFYMGVYRIEGDMIIGHRYFPPNNSFFVGTDWTLWEERYKIVNRTTIKRVYFRGLLKANDYTVPPFNRSPWVDDPPHIFVPAKNLPTDNWLKEERWIWRNESDWKSYMERIRQNKQAR